MRIRYPVRKANGQEYRNYDELITDLRKNGHGWWLLGANRQWHGGIHIGSASSPESILNPKTPEKSLPLQCMADGDVVAWRIKRDYDRPEYPSRDGPVGLRNSSMLLVVQSVYKPDENDESSWLTLYQVYMHMAPLSEYPRRKMYRVTAHGNGVRMRQYSRGDEDSAVAPPVMTGRQGVLTLKAGETLVGLRKALFKASGNPEPFALVQKLKDGSPSGDFFWVSADPKNLEPEGECYACLPAWMQSAVNHGVFDEVVLPPAPLKVTLNAGEPVGFLGAQDLIMRSYSSLVESEYKTHIELMSTDAHVKDFLANAKGLKTGRQFVKLKLKGDLWIRLLDGTFRKTSAINRKDGDRIISREATHPFTNEEGMTWFQISESSWMHQDDVEQLSQHDLTALNFHAIEAATTTDFTRTLDESWLTEAISSLRTHFDGEKGPDSGQMKRFYDDLLGNIALRDAGKMNFVVHQALDDRIFFAIHTQQLNVAELASRFVVKHDSEWTGDSKDARWSQIFADRYDPMKVPGEHFMDSQHWTESVPPFNREKQAWHFHPLEFLEMLRTDDGRITVVMLRKIWIDPALVSDDVLHQVANELNANLDICHLNTEERLYHFMAQVYQETGPKLSISESLDYPSSRLPLLFSYYRDHVDEQFVDGRTEAHKSDQVNIANKVYGGRNGNVNPGDGWRYRGRGMKQITGRYNYRVFTKYSEKVWGETINFEDNPELVSSSIKQAVRSALFFWDAHALYKMADGGITREACDEITNIVNSGTDSRELRYMNLVHFSDAGIFSDVF